MKTRKLRDIVVSEVGMGCMSFSHGYGQIPDENYSVEAIHKAYDFGCTFFDTAEVYGPNLDPQYFGHNEKILGKALKNFRKEVVVATKLHIPTDEAQADKNIYVTIRRHLENSFARLQTDYADIYYLHRVNPEISLEDVAEAMGKLIKDGLIRGWGLSQVPLEILEKVQKITPLTALQSIYSMVERGVEEKIIPYCLENKIGFVAFSPIASGFLSGKITAETKFEKFDDVRNFVPQLKKENIIANQPILDLIGRFAKLKNATNAQISLAWMLKKFSNVVPIPGSKNQDRILENLGASNVELTGAEFNELENSLNGLKIYVHRGFDESNGKSFLDVEEKVNGK